MKEQVECSDDPERGIECTLFFLPQKEVDQKNAARGKDPLSSLHAFCNFQCNHRFRAGFIFSLKNFCCFCLIPCLYVSLCISVSMTVYLQSLCLSVYLSVCLFAVCLWLNQLLRVGVQATPVRAHRSFVNLEITKEPASRICCFVTEVDPITNIAPTITKLQSTQIKKSQWNEIQIERSQ